MGEVLEFEADEGIVSGDRREDIHEVLNYRRAMFFAERQLRDLPFSQRIVRGAHKVLLDGVRGQNKAPGEYRSIPNWIGPPGCSIEDAHFIPIPAGAPLRDAMAGWEQYAHRECPDKLVQLAILHAEFESLHPFLDGNGRIGRMLIPLFLWQNRFLQHPTFYISRFFEARRDIYYERLLAVSRDDDWTGWCVFFLEAVRTQADDNLEKAQAILRLYEDLKRRIPELTRSQHAIRAVDWIFDRPIFRSPDFFAGSGIPSPTAKRMIKVMHQSGIIKKLIAGAGRRASVYSFPALLNIAEGTDVF